MDMYYSGTWPTVPYRCPNFRGLGKKGSTVSICLSNSANMGFHAYPGKLQRISIYLSIYLVAWSSPNTCAVCDPAAYWDHTECDCHPHIHILAQGGWQDAGLLSQH